MSKATLVALLIGSVFVGLAAGCGVTELSVAADHTGEGGPLHPDAPHRQQAEAALQNAQLFLNQTPQQALTPGLRLADLSVGPDGCYSARVELVTYFGFRTGRHLRSTCESVGWEQS